MPSVSAKQQRFMQAVAHDPTFAAKAGVPMAVGQEFNRADTGKPPLTTPGGVVSSGGYLARRRPR